MTPADGNLGPAGAMAMSPDPRSELRGQARPFAGLADRAFQLLCGGAALLLIALVVFVVLVLIQGAWLSMETTGWDFFTSAEWDPEPTHRVFGALAFVYGTVVTSILAMLLAVPMGIATATFLAEIAPHFLRRLGSFLVEMLAAIPSVVYGFWGLYVFVPALERFVAAVGGPENAGTGVLPAGLVLGIMIVPYAAAVAFDVIRAVPQSQREASLALGATHWQTIWRAVLPYASPGIIGGCFLALGRALGETMAVTMLIGNRTHIPNFMNIDFSNLSESLKNLFFAKGNSIPSVIANEFTEATYDLYLSALVELGLVLLLVSVGFSALGRLFIWRMNRPRARGAGFLSGVLSGLFRRSTIAAAPAQQIDDGPAPRHELPPPSRLARWANRAMTGGSPRTVRVGLWLVLVLAILFAAVTFLVSDPDWQRWLSIGLGGLALITVLATMGVLGLCLVLTTVPLFLIVGYLLYRGATSLNWNFFTQLPKPVGEAGGGMANAFYGSFLMVGIATVFSVSIGLLTAIYLAEYRSGRLGAVVRFLAEMLSSVPSIVIGIFGYYAIAKPITHGFSGLAGGFALGIMMLPIVIRASEEALKLVPSSLRQASRALGASHWQTVLRVSVPAALPAIITAIFLGIARVAGETAPLLLTASNNRYWPRSLNDYTPSLPVYIFNYAVSPYEDWHRQAWAAAFVLVSAIMILNITIRFVTGKRAILASQAA